MVIANIWYVTFQSAEQYARAHRIFHAGECRKWRNTTLNLISSVPNASWVLTRQPWKQLTQGIMSLDLVDGSCCTIVLSFVTKNIMGSIAYAREGTSPMLASSLSCLKFLPPWTFAGLKTIAAMTSSLLSNLQAVSPGKSSIHQVTMKHLRLRCSSPH